MAGQAFHYLNRASAPNVGSWGAAAAGDRLVVCPGAGPDLIIESLTHEPQYPAAGQTVIFTAVVKNIGSGAAGPSTLSLRVGCESPDEPASQFAVPLLQPGESARFQRQAVLSAGSFVTTAAADLFAEVSEVLETNNELQDFYSVSP